MARAIVYHDVRAFLHYSGALTRMNFSPLASRMREIVEEESTVNPSLSRGNLVPERRAGSRLKRYEGTKRGRKLACSLLARIHEVSRCNAESSNSDAFL